MTFHLAFKTVSLKVNLIFPKQDMWKFAPNYVLCISWHIVRKEIPYFLQC